MTKAPAVITHIMRNNPRGFGNTASYWPIAADQSREAEELAEYANRQNQNQSSWCKKWADCTAQEQSDADKVIQGLTKDYNITDLMSSLFDEIKG